MIDDLRSTIDELKARRNVIYRAIGKLDQDRAIIHKTLATLDQTIETLEQLNADDKTPEKINNARTAQNIPANIPCVTLPEEILPPGPVPAPAVSPKTIEEADRLAARMRNKAKAEQAAVKAERAQGGRKLCRPFSESGFKGVSAVKSSKDGHIRWRTQFWDSKQKRVVSAGTFDEQFEAALAVAQKIGDAAEVRRLEDMIEQRENNPDRPPKKTRETGDGIRIPRKETRAGRRQEEKEKAKVGKERSRKGVGAGRRHNYSRPHKGAVKKDLKSGRADKSQISESGDPPQSELASMGGLPKGNATACVWQCRKCGHHHLQELIPENCANCNSDEGFRKIE